MVNFNMAMFKNNMNFKVGLPVIQYKQYNMYTFWVTTSTNFYELKFIDAIRSTESQISE